MVKIPGLKGKKHKDTTMRHLMHDFRKISMLNRLENLAEYLNQKEINFINEYSAGWLEKYKDGWNLLK